MMGVEYLREAVESVLSQTYIFLEIISWDNNFNNWYELANISGKSIEE
jgi:hypothetical protein